MKDIQSFVDPISQEIMTNPEVTAAGHAYQRESIREWLRNRRTDPNTRQNLGENPQLVADRTLRGAIEENATITKNKSLDLAGKFIAYGQFEDAEQMIARATELNEKFANEDFGRKITEVAEDLNQSRQGGFDHNSRRVVTGSGLNLARAVSRGSQRK